MKRQSIGIVVIGFVLSVTSLGPAMAESIPDDWWRGTWSAQVENDKIANTDRHYTNGARLSWVSDRRDDGPEWTRDLLETLYPFVSLKGARAGLAMGHNIYTPTDTDATTLQLADRPYAGWAYIEASLHAEALDRTYFGYSVDTLDSVAVNLGWVGPQAYGREVQNNFHDLIGVSKSLGWKHQLKNEPTMALMVERKWRPKPVSLSVLEVGAVPFVGGSLGNSFTLATAGLTLRIGQNINSDYGPPLVRPTFSGMASLEKTDVLSWYLFAGVEGRAVLRNIFLDGNTFTDSHSVDRNTFVGDLQFGAAVTLYGVRTALTIVNRSKEFDAQNKPDRYGVASVSVHF